MKYFSLLFLCVYIHIIEIYCEDEELEEMTVGGGVMDEDMMDDIDDHYTPQHTIHPKPISHTFTKNTKSTIPTLSLSMDQNVPNAPDINQLFSNPFHTPYSHNTMHSIEPIRMRSRSENMNMNSPNFSNNMPQNLSNSMIQNIQPNFSNAYPNTPFNTTNPSTPMMLNSNTTSMNHSMQNMNSINNMNNNMQNSLNSINSMQNNSLNNSLNNTMHNSMNNSMQNTMHNTMNNNNTNTMHNTMNNNNTNTMIQNPNIMMMHNTPMIHGNTMVQHNNTNSIQEEAGYIVPRFPTKYHILPAFNQPPQCTMQISVSELTDGKVDILKHGGLQISYNMYQQKLKFYTFGKPKYSTRNVLKFPYWVYKKLFTSIQEYTSMVLIPQGCVVYPQDKNIMHTIQHPNTPSKKSNNSNNSNNSNSDSNNTTISGGTLYLSTEEFALYTPVDIHPPIDILEYGIHYGKQDFKMVGPCIMSAHFPVAPHQIVVSSSILNVSIIIQTPQGTEVIQATYPEVCMPLFFNRISVWVLPITDGSTVLIATSPPIVVGDRQEQWKLVPLVTEDIIQAHSYIPSTN